MFKICSGAKMYFSQQQQEIYDRLKERIVGGDYAPGAGFPKEVDLASHFQVARNTLRPCLEQLEKEGLLVRIKRKGSFVTDKALDFQKYKNVGLIMPALDKELIFSQSPTHYMIFDGIQRFSHDNFWDIQIITRRGEELSFKKISRFNISGLIIVLPNRAVYGMISELKKHKIPFICINLYSEEVNRQVSFVNIDFYGAACEAVTRLSSKVKKNIGLVSSYEMKQDTHPFYICEGYKRTIKELGLNEKIITPSEVEHRLPAREMANFFRANLDEIKKYDAIITTNSDEAFALYNILNLEKIRIPESISLISFFDDENTRKVGITSYSPDLRELGYNSSSLLSEILEDKDFRIRQQKIMPKLFVRYSG
jgi:DNA-binding LacI/PurR family transcriptional regulator